MWRRCGGGVGGRIGYQGSIPRVRARISITKLGGFLKTQASPTLIAPWQRVSVGERAPAVVTLLLQRTRAPTVTDVMRAPAS